MSKDEPLCATDDLLPRGRSFAATMSSIIKSYRARRAHRKAIIELNSLDERLLRDMGIIRDDIKLKRRDSGTF